jgi:phosphoglycolate phosphatase
MGYHLYIVSNCQSGYIEAFLDYYRFHDLFEDIECYGNNTKQKNENISLIMNRNNLGKAVYVGDIQGDYEATTKAGLPFIHAAYGFGKINADVDRINSLKELPEIIGNII